MVTTNTASSSENESFSFADLEAHLDGKDPAQQLEALNDRLVLEIRIKEGAENLLNVKLSAAQRHKVETELDMAKSKIEAITRRIEQHDFHTALQYAQSCIKTLISLARSGGSSQGSPSADVDRERIDTMKRLIAILQRSLRVRYEMDIAEVVRAVAPALADAGSRQSRSAAYRVMRHALVDADSVQRLREQSIDWYIIKSLIRDNKNAAEKEQAIKLIRALVEVGTVRSDRPTAGSAGVVPLSEPIMRALIAVAEHLEDPFRPICIQTLTEILLIDIDLVARTGGLRFLLHVTAEGPTELAPTVTAALLHIVDVPRTRAYLCIGSDLEIALSTVTDSYGKGADHADKIRACSKVIHIMLRTWSGLMYFCMEDMRGIRSLVDVLRLPSLETRETILDIFFDLLRIPTPDWYKTFLDGRRLTMYRKSRVAPTKSETEPEPERAPTSTSVTERANLIYKLTDQYIGLLLVILVHAGLIDALTSMLSESTSGSMLTRKATLLVAEILQLANKLLPLSIAARLQAIPRIFDMAADFKNGEHRIVGTLALSAIDSLNRNRARLDPHVKNSSTFRPRANSVEDSVRRGQRQVEQVKLKMGMQMDDKSFQALLIETQVMITKDYTKWDYDTLQGIVEGSLMNPKRLEEVIKLSRFMRRLMSFFHPFSHRFADIPREGNNMRWVRLGCSLLVTFMASPDGVRYLATEDVFLTQIVKSFAQLDPFNGTLDSDPIFSERRVATTLTYGYLEMLGTLSRYKDGIELLEKAKIFTAFYHLSELRSREDLIKGIIENLDYSIDGHPRIVLSKALTSSYKHIRIYATRHLGALIRESTQANAWTLRLLLTQLYDPSPDVCSLAVRFLEEACESKDILQLVVEMQPTMDHLGEIGHTLLLKFMSTPIGFRYLYNSGYIDREMDMWFHERNLSYVVQVETFLSKVFGGDHDSDSLTFEENVPPHFYGEMAKTDLGCQILHEKGHFAEYAQFIRQHGLESEDIDLIIKLKSILWAVGNVGSTEGGLPFLEEEDIIPAVLDIAEQSPIPSIRGTCFFILGLISSTPQGAEILDDYEWGATVSPLGMPTGLCIPLDLDRFISILPWTQHVPERRTTVLKPPADQKEHEVLTAIQNLANSVIANNAARSLARMKSRPEYQHVFSSPSALYRALYTISTQRYRLPVRRHILDLFELELDAGVVDAMNECARSLANDTAQQSPLSDAKRITCPPTVSLRPVSKIAGFP
ncbi:hypothetical protein FISHEDRAFT_66904 [Fistulina hepatica ATCC 64428]|uniref:REM-1 domain-containing protein n=1 Tax=Fistulina hepatica ATCC 64428 TaxID=1128425 RepID=A0A0D7A4G9_9AGAR|nr:hypothetical protein FISHEDRAFT_66904 [Fistulina hepatica ATCC 64428]